VGCETVFVGGCVFFCLICYFVMLN
jgi:hypothetical protein